MMPQGELKGLDIGCGTGEVGKLIQDLRPSTQMLGTDVLVRSCAVIPVLEYDGELLPFEDRSFDFAMLIDVLHHTEDPLKIFKEALRVSRSFVLVKDHYCQNSFDRVLLRFMDWVGNRAHDVEMPFNYLSRQEWRQLADSAGVESSMLVEKPKLYREPISIIFDRNLHFVSKLVRTGQTDA